MVRPAASAYDRGVIEDSPGNFDVARARADFPLLAASVHGKPLVYLDNGATTQKPAVVIDAMDRYYRESNANIHRAVHHLSQHATDLFEQTRRKVQRFLNAPHKNEVIFTRGTTESVNLVAQSFSRLACRPGDEILISALEHHSNIVPWQIAAQERGLILKVIPIDDTGELRYDAIDGLLSPRTKIVSVTHASNALGTIIDVRRIVAAARKVGARVLVDGAQMVGHGPVDVQALGCDFYIFSGHKLFGPTGTGVLWGRRELLEAMPPYQGGGDMIRAVSFDKTTYAELPNKFEAGTPDIAGVIGLGVAIDYVTALDRAAVDRHEADLLAYATAQLSSIPGLRIVGTAAHKAPIISFVMTSPALDHHTLGTLLDGEGVAVRTGHHCCMPLMERLGLPGTTRASFSLYNTRADVDRLVAAIRKIRAALGSTPAPSAASDLVFAPASASSVGEASQMILDDFALFDDWEQRHDYMIDLGKKIAPLPMAMKIEPHRVHGCQSTVYMVARKQPGSVDRIDLAAESDAFIVNGLIAILLSIFSGQRAGDILGFDVDAFFARLGLTHHLSMGRRNGLAGMVSRIRNLSGSLVHPGTSTGDAA